MITRSWTFLVVAGIFEVVWAIGLKYSQGFTSVGATALTLAALIASFYLLARSLETIPVGTAYAVWTGIGAVGTAVLGIMLFGEPRHLARLACILIVVIGIIGLKVTAAR
ncbi:MAG: multidrug efflux SMR transporter [Gemmatimonadota bacterium]